MGARLICRDASGTITYKGQYGSGGTPDSSPAYELRCDTMYPDALMVGGISALNYGPNQPADVWMGRPGVICASQTAAYMWRIEPVGPAQTNHIYTDVCTGAHEAVSAINIKTGWWCDGFQLSCTPVTP
jgi:hypothetical protein